MQMISIAVHQIVRDIPYIRFGSLLYRQIVGIPMGTNCAPLVAVLFLLIPRDDSQWALRFAPVCPSVCLSVCPSVRPSVRHALRYRVCVIDSSYSF